MSAKQIILQKVREAERALVYEEYKDRVGEVLSGNNQTHRKKRSYSRSWAGQKL